MTKSVDAFSQKDRRPDLGATLRAFVDRMRSSSAGAAQTLLIVGDPATTAEAATTVARNLKRTLVRVPSSALAPPSVGETTKLDRILATTASSDAVLFFDEADALFGKRSDVKDSHDRYANVEVGALLQRLEARGGVVVIATRHRPDLDDAFTRRFAAVAYIDPVR